MWQALSEANVKPPGRSPPTAGAADTPGASATFRPIPTPRHPVMSASRNEPCPCGSGKKYKNCCAGNVPLYKRSTWTGALVALFLLGGLLLAGLAVLRPDRSGAPGAAPPGKVWSAEHGHWHDAP